MPRNKKTATTVVRPMTRGEQNPKKVVLGSLAELNDHAPMVCPQTFAPLLRTRPLPPCDCPTPCFASSTTTIVDADAHDASLQEQITAHWRIYEETTPWYQESRSTPQRYRDWTMTRRNPGRDDGKTWVSRRYVCGNADEPAANGSTDETYDEDVEHEWEAGWEDQSGHEYERDRARMEVAIMDIAKPAKPRGTSCPNQRGARLNGSGYLYLQGLRRSTRWWKQFPG